MSIGDIFIQKRKAWDRLLTMRKTAENKEETCPACGKKTPAGELAGTHFICPACGAYFPMPPKERIALCADPDSFKELFFSLRSEDPLRFPGYEKKLAESRKRTGQADAFVAGVCRIHGGKVAIGVLNGAFLMGSMGAAVGEKLVRLTEYAAKKGLPLLIFSASGGARMQEGLFSLLQMAKTAAAVERFKRGGGLFISCLTHPTTGGVSASYASLGDIILAEPDALICFAGPRVIEQTIGQTLPEGFQHAEFLLEHGMIDRIVERSRMRQTIYKLLKLHQM